MKRDGIPAGGGTRRVLPGEQDASGSGNADRDRCVLNGRRARSRPDARRRVATSAKQRDGEGRAREAAGHGFPPPQAADGGAATQACESLYFFAGDDEPPAVSILQ